MEKCLRYKSEIAAGITDISINLLVVYRESVNLIGYITGRLSADSLQLWIANENVNTWCLFHTSVHITRSVWNLWIADVNTIKHFFLNVT